MQLTAFILLVFGLSLSARSISQTVNFTGKDVSVRVAFDAIQEQTGYYVLANREALTTIGKVSVEAKDMEVRAFLSLLLINQPYDFDIDAKSIFIRSKTSRPELQLPILPPIKISGTIVGPNNHPLSGATIQVKGKNIITTSDEKGYFELNADEGSTLIISYVGFYEREFKVRNAKDVKVELEKTSNSMDTAEVVYNTGFQSVPKERATGSFVKIDNATINRTQTFNIIDRLEGVTNGLLFDRRIDGDGNPKYNLQIRGLFTLTESISQPLIILDNFPFYGDINSINPNDIEDITILRDAAAASIWGAKAGNGVIVLTSKKGKYNQQMKISAGANFTTVGKPNLSKLPILGSNDWINLEKYYYQQGAYEYDVLDFYNGPLSPVVEILEKARTHQISQEEADATILKLRNHDVRDDFLKYIYRPSIAQQYTVNLSGGGKNNNYYLSIGYDKQAQSLIGNDNDRLSVRLANTFEPIKNLNIQVGIAYSVGSTHDNSLGGFRNINYNLGYSTPLPIYSSLADENGNATTISKKFRTSFTDTIGGGHLLDWKFKPLDEQKYRDSKTKTNSILATLGVNYKLAPFLSFDLQYQYQTTTSDFHQLFSLKTFETRDLINTYTNLQANDLLMRYPVPLGGYANDINSILENQSIRTTLNFSKRLSGGHQIVAFAGFSTDAIQKNETKKTTYGIDDNLNTTNVDLVNSYMTIYGYPAPIFNNLNSLDKKLDHFMSVFSNFSYDYKGRYTVTGSIRRDASNLFGVSTNNRWKPLWSMGAAWNLLNESFIKLDFLSQLSLRATYGYAGNVNNSLSAYNILYFLPASSNYPINLPFATLQSLGNPNLRWEKVRTINWGVDFALKNQQLNGSIEYYVKKSVDVIGNQPLDMTAGYPTISSNSACITGKGIDIRLNGKIINNKNLKWESNFNFNYISYKVDKVLLGTATKNNGYQSDGIRIQAIEGQTPYLIVSYRWKGLDATSGDPQGILNGKISKNYDSLVYYSPFEEQVINGSALPIIYGNFLNNFRWKNLSISANITYKLKYFLRRPSIAYSGLVRGNAHSDYMNRWQKSGDEVHTSVPSLVYPSPETRDQFYQYSEINILPGDHIRLEDIRMSYNLSNISMLRLQELTIFGQLSNLNILLWRKNKNGIDPDYPGGSIIPKSFSFGIRVGF